ncbi:ParB N-terminal domain-containing protein [Celeribacter sp.]|uniref:ParB N-terminal domain-containing protein n=1 Tax=Celeribacter sp. TaxID=1890673 RepID=UPI003A8D1543
MTKQRTCLERGRKTSVRLDQINLESEAGTARPGPLIKEHVKDLVRTKKNVGKLDPVLLWKNPDRPEDPYIILDGRHRVAAYRTSKQTQKIPAEVLECPFRDALLISGQRHTNSSLALTSQERADFAWRLVWEDLGYSKKEISQASGVSTRQVAYMRKRLKEIENTKGDITGDWWRDKKEQTVTEDKPMMTDALHRQQVDEMAKAIRDLFDRRGNPLPFWNNELVAEATAQALGEQKLRMIYEYSFGGLDDEEDEWGDLPVRSYPDEDPHAETEEDTETDF